MRSIVKALNLSVETTGTFTVITVAGELDTGTAPELERAIQDALAEGPSALLLDLSSTEYVSSMGLRVFLSTLKVLRARQGRLILAGLNTEVQEIMDMAGFSPLFEITKTVEDAHASMAG